ncbi:MAG: hypothetical protein QNJ20_03840 [Paracoccaceae bacterium]|nr:hypothetical protein [Paracoccaceae bacterium]
MTAPDTNIEKQKKRHWPVFFGIAGAALLVIAAMVVLSPVEETAEEVVETSN